MIYTSLNLHDKIVGLTLTTLIYLCIYRNILILSARGPFFYVRIWCLQTSDSDVERWSPRWRGYDVFPRQRHTWMTKDLINFRHCLPIYAISSACACFHEMLSDIHCPLHLSLVSYTTFELEDNTPETANVEKNIFRPKWNPELTTRFTETLGK